MCAKPFSTFNGHEVKDAQARQELYGRPVTPQMFGAVGDGVTDDSTAFQNAINASNHVYVPAGTYLLKNVALKGHLKITGEKNKTFIKTAPGYDTVAFIYNKTVEFIEVSDMAFIGEGIAVSYVNKEDWFYLSSSIFKNCQFYRSLSCCIRANLILCSIEHCTFGYLGVVNGSGIHNHIECISTVTGLQSTTNKLYKNRFYGATGFSCHFESSMFLIVDGNNIERNETGKYTMIFKGCTNVYVCNNWFELNQGTHDMFFGVDEPGIYDNYIVDIRNNVFMMHEATRALCRVKSSRHPDFLYNYGNMYNVPLTEVGTSDASTAFNRVKTFYRNNLFTLGGDPIKQKLDVSAGFSASGLNDNVWFKDFDPEDGKSYGWNKSANLVLSAGILTDSLGNGMRYSCDGNSKNHIYKSFPAFYLKGKTVKITAIGKVDATGQNDYLCIGYNFTEASPTNFTRDGGTALNATTYKTVEHIITIPDDAQFVHIGFTTGGTLTKGHIVAFDVSIIENPNDLITTYLGNH